MKAWIALMSLFAVGSAYADDASLFIYQIEPDNTEMTPPVLLVDSEPSEQPLEFDLVKPCDIKCGIRNTGMVLVHIAAESEQREIERLTLMLPQYEP
ncbi:hypothetical protein [Vibrio sonorensis]|uniref:hypothetical protein n=1 Tax=Vibrio sonorensis TaxID=1004316 RepID=UPI0011142000|nr:hypothetical protein [Vibrio sonorensis]